MDPFEHAEESGDYPHRRADHLGAMVPAQALVDEFLQTFKNYPPRAKSASFSLDQVLQKMHGCGRAAAVISFHTRAVTVVVGFDDFA